MHRTVVATASIALLIALSSSLGAAVGAAFGSTELTLLSNRDPCDCTGPPLGFDYSDIWGFSRGGVDYAIIASFTGTYIYDLSDPSQPIEASYIAGPESGWRDMKTLGNYLYATNEASGGLQIIDISDPHSATEVIQTSSFFATAHNLYIDPATSRAFIFGANATQSNPILDFTVPTAPLSLGNWDVHYLHDGYVLNDVLYGSKIASDGGVEPGLFLLDVTDPGNPSTIVNFTWPNSTCHNVWTTADGNYAATTDERTGGHMRLWNLTNPLEPVQASEYSAGDKAIIHNVYILGHTAYLSYYSEGVRVVDISDPTAAIEKAYYDTTPGGEIGLHGAWGIYAFESGLIIASDVDTGLYVFEQTPTAAVAVDGSPSPLSTMQPAFPNPFNPRTQLGLTLDGDGAPRVSLRIFDATGRIVRSLHDGRLTAGSHTWAWDGRSDRGHTVSSGTYYVRLDGPTMTQTQSVVLLK